MSFKRNLQKSLSGYFSRSTLVRPQLLDTLNEIAVKLPETVVFGGVIREFAFGDARNFVSDIDLVTLSSRSELENAVGGFNPNLNKFGGFRFVENAQRFDIWSLSDTWAFKEGFVSGDSFEDLLKTTFFNVDAAFFHLSSKKLKLSDGYEGWIKNKILDINLIQNPRPENMVRRTMFLIIHHQMGISKKLANFVAQYGRISNMSFVEERVFERICEHVYLARDGIFRLDPQRTLID